MNHHPDIADARLFERLLFVERRRCERTAGRFGLVQIEVSELARTLPPGQLEAVARAAGAAVRETDIAGWCGPSTIGVILTALNGASRDTVESAVTPRIEAALASRLDAEQVRQVRIRCQVFPEDEGDGTGDRDRALEPVRTGQGAGHPAYPLKRMVDVAGSLAALVLFSPLWVVIPALVKLTSPGPVFFRQERVGRRGRKFTFLKFRSMYIDSDPAIHEAFVRNLIEGRAAGSNGTYKIQNDPRVTPLGRFLRKSSLDELPQFLNVLRGEMSLVGPRPPIPYEIEKYALWHRRRFLEAKPGITGPWQVHGRSRTTFDEMVRMDLGYIRSQSLWLDLKLLLETPSAVLSGNGAH